MKAHGVNPSGGGPITPTKTPTKGKSKAAAVTPSKPGPKGRKRKVDEVKDEDEEEEFKVKKQDDDAEGAEDAKEAKKAKAISDWIDEGSLMLRNIPQVPQSVLEALERESRPPVINDDEDDSCIVVSATDLRSLKPDGSTSRDVRRGAAVPALKSASPSVLDSSPPSTLPAGPNSFPSITRPSPYDFAANMPISPQNLTASLMSSNPTHHVTDHSHSMTIRPSPINDFIHPRYSGSSQTYPLAAWSHSSSPHQLFWAPHQESHVSKEHNHG